MLDRAGDESAGRRKALNQPWPMHQQLPFVNKPVLVFWETTRACDLSCAHCRASAMTEPLPGELSTEEGMELIDQVASFGRPYPTIIFTGGDPLKRRDLFELMAYAKGLGLGFAVSPAMTTLADRMTMSRIRGAGATSISISRDVARADTHDSIRGIEGTFDRTVGTTRDATAMGLRPQINTAVMKRNFRELPELFHLIRQLGVKTWEVFFVVKVGRGTSVEDLTPRECESVCNFLYDASFYGVTVRCVEAPFIRRVSARRRESGRYWDSAEYVELSEELVRLEGKPSATQSSIGPTGTLDGDGVVFVAHDGEIHPGGLLPLSLGNIRKDNLAQVYRDDPLLRRIRGRQVVGDCGNCMYSETCGGSRARAFSAHGDPLASDPACLQTLHQLA